MVKHDLCDTLPKKTISLWYVIKNTCTVYMLTQCGQKLALFPVSSESKLLGGLGTTILAEHWAGNMFIKTWGRKVPPCWIEGGGGGANSLSAVCACACA